MTFTSEFYRYLLIPWHNKMGNEVARLLASCDTSILFLKLLQVAGFKWYEFSM